MFTTSGSSAETTVSLTINFSDNNYRLNLTMNNAGDGSAFALYIGKKSVTNFKVRLGLAGMTYQPAYVRRVDYIAIGY